MLSEKKSTCCHRCGHVHVKGTSCPKPFLTGAKSCARRSLKEGEETKHYKERKAERGTIADIEIPQEAYGDRNVEKVKANLIPILQAKLDAQLSYVEKSDLGFSNNFNVGLITFLPIIVHKGKSFRIKMTATNNEDGLYYLVIVANNALITMYPTNKKEEALLQEIERHVKEERPQDVRPPKVQELRNYIYKIDIDGNEVKDIEKKPEIEKTSEESLDYKVRTDYRVGATFDHKQFGPGKIVAADMGGRAGTDGRIAWIDVKYDKPFMKGGKLQDTRRFNNIFTAAYFGKTLKKELHTIDHHGHDEHHQVRADIEEMSLTSTGVHEFLQHIKTHPELIDKLGFTKIEDIEDYIGQLGSNREDQQEWQNLKIQAGMELDETDQYCASCLAEYLLEYENKIEEAEYRGRKVSLGKPFLTPGGPKKRSVYVKNAKGNVVKVNFGDPNLKIKKNIPARRKAFRARHKCSNPGPRWKARYWSCKAW